MVEVTTGDQLLDILQLALDSEGDLNLVLKACVENGVFNVQGNSANTVVPQIVNVCLNKKNTTYNGLLLLKEFIPYSSVETYSDHAIFWMSQCLKVINQKDVQIKLLSLEVLAKLLEVSDKFTEVSKEAGKQIVPKLLTELLKHTDNNVQIIVNILRCLEICMKLYSGPCESQKENILQYLISCLESGARVVQLAASCVSCLPSLGGGGKQGITYKGSWSLQHEQLVSSLHSILDLLFENITEIQGNRKSEVQGIVFPPLPDKNTLSRAQHLVARFSGIAECLCAMHLKSFCVVKQIDVRSVLGVVCRGLAVTSVTLSNKVSMETLALTSVLPTVHIALMQVLESFILCCGRNIISEGFLICKLLHQVFKWTSAKSDSGWRNTMNKPYRSIRMAAYKCLCTWLSIAQSSSCIQMFTDELIPAILSDIYSKKPTITLTMCPKTMKVGKKQLKKQLSAMAKTGEERREMLGVMSENKSLCIKALNTLELIVNSASILLKPEEFKIMEITLLQILMEMGGGSTEIPVPYSDPECRDQLYKLLLALCLVHNLTKYSLSFFTAGLNDPSPQVRSCCQSALSSLEKIYHPSAPSLRFPKECENHVLSMTEKDILNAPLTSLSNNGVLVVRIINNEVKTQGNAQKLKVNTDTVVKEEIPIAVDEQNQNVNDSMSENEQLDKLYSNLSKTLPCDSFIEIIDLSDSEGQSENEMEEMYDFSDEGKYSECYSEDELNVSNCDFHSDNDLTIDENLENDILNGSNGLQREEQKIDIGDEIDSAFGREIDSIVSEVNSYEKDLKRNNSDNMDLCDSQLIKKPKLEGESHVNGEGESEDEEALMMKDFVNEVC